LPLPHLPALILEEYRNSKPVDVRRILLNVAAVDGAVKNPGAGSPNLLLQSAFTVTPTISPAPTNAPSQNPTQAPTSCDGTVFVLDLTLDNYPEETSWEVIRNSDGKPVAKGGPYENVAFRSNVFEAPCLPKGSITDKCS